MRSPYLLIVFTSCLTVLPAWAGDRWRPHEPEAHHETQARFQHRDRRIEEAVAHGDLTPAEAEDLRQKRQSQKQHDSQPQSQSQDKAPAPAPASAS